MAGSTWPMPAHDHDLVVGDAVARRAAVVPAAPLDARRHVGADAVLAAVGPAVGTGAERDAAAGTGGRGLRPRAAGAAGRCRRRRPARRASGRPRRRPTIGTVAAVAGPTACSVARVDVAVTPAAVGGRLRCPAGRITRRARGPHRARRRTARRTGEAHCIPPSSVAQLPTYRCCTGRHRYRSTSGVSRHRGDNAIGREDDIRALCALGAARSRSSCSCSALSGAGLVALVGSGPRLARRALVAVGLVLVYRANRIVNFAQGDLGGAGRILAASLIVGPRLGVPPCGGGRSARRLLLGVLDRVS